MKKVLLLAVAALMLAGCHKKPAQQEQQPGQAKFIDFTCVTIVGDTVRLSEQLTFHKFVLVDFWASWCRPCRESMPALKEVYGEYSDRLEIIGMSVDKDLQAWEDTVYSLGLPWLHCADILACEGHPAEDYGIQYIPTTFLINSEGVILAKEPEIEELRALLDAESESE